MTGASTHASEAELAMLIETRRGVEAQLQEVAQMTNDLEQEASNAQTTEIKNQHVQLAA